MCPDPVETASSTWPLTVRLRSKVASLAKTGRAAKATAAAANAKCFICSSIQLRLRSGTGFCLLWFPDYFVLTWLSKCFSYGVDRGRAKRTSTFEGGACAMPKPVSSATSLLCVTRTLSRDAARKPVCSFANTLVRVRTASSVRIPGRDENWFPHVFSLEPVTMTDEGW